MPDADTLDILILLARPGAGKSEIIHYLKKVPLNTRKKRFHVGEFEEIDDFPMLWTWFEEDDLLQKMGQPRLHSDEKGYFLGEHLWHLLIERICLEYHKKLRDDPSLHGQKTILIEFSRGSEHGGYAAAFQHLSPQVASRAAILYLNVSWEESLRKNRKRFNPAKPDSILEHGLEDEKLARLYREIDWEQVSAANPHYLTIQGYSVPYVAMPNEDDVTTRGGEALGERLAKYLKQLWKLYQKKP